jgi:hypothetical protein
MKFLKKPKQNPLPDLQSMSANLKNLSNTWNQNKKEQE